MDHVIDAMKPFYEVTLEEFMEYHKTGEYKKLSDNPVYKEIKALIDARNILYKYMGWPTVNLSEEVKYYD